MKLPIKLDSLSVGIPFLKVTFKIANDTEREIAQELLIRSEDKRFLTSWQCCSNCTENAIESVLDYRNFLLDKKVELSKIKDSKLFQAVSYILDEAKKFLSISEECDIYNDQKYLSKQLEVLRNNILSTLKKFCEDTRIDYPNNLFNMMK